VKEQTLGKRKYVEGKAARDGNEVHRMGREWWE
jgi:hypothetical protein